MNNPAPSPDPLNSTSGDRDATQPQETAKRETTPERNHHCESRRGGHALIEQLGLEPLEGEGGHVRRMYADDNMSSAIYLMIAPDFSALHRLDTPEVYHWQGGAPVRMLVLEPGGTSRRVVLGPDLDAGHVLQTVVPAGAWQGSRPDGAWSLVGLTLAPPFRHDGFTLGDRTELQDGWPEAAAEIDELTRG